MKDRPVATYYAADLGEPCHVFASAALMAFFLAYLGRPSAEHHMAKLFDGIAPFGGPNIDAAYGSLNGASRGPRREPE